MRTCLAALVLVMALAMATSAIASPASATTVWVHPDSQALLSDDTVHVHMFVLVGPYSVESYVGGAQYRFPGDTEWLDAAPLYDEHQVMDTEKLPAPHPFAGENWVQGFNIVFGAAVEGTPTPTSIEYRLWAAAAAADGEGATDEATGSLAIRNVTVDAPTSVDPIKVSMLIAKAYTDGVDTHVHLVVDFYPPSQTLAASAWIRTNVQNADQDEWLPSGAVSQFEHFYDPVPQSKTAATVLYSRYNLSWKIAGKALSSLSYLVTVRDGQGAHGASQPMEVRVVPISVPGVVVPPDDCTVDAVSPLLSTLFASLGNDCETYAGLYAPDALYYHQHDGFKTGPQLLANCQGYGEFCPPGTCSFQQKGAPSVVQGSDPGTCRILVPYLWAELPANNKVPGNMEPHTGWEYLEVTADETARFGYKINVFAEVETSYSVALNWGHPNDTSVYGWTTDLLNVTASKGECNTPIAPLVTDWMRARPTHSSDVWRQQGDAVVLAVGGICHVAVPYAADVGQLLQTGRVLFVLTPDENEDQGYTITRAVEFQTATQPSPSPPSSQGGSENDKAKTAFIVLAIIGWVFVVVLGVYTLKLRKKVNGGLPGSYVSMN